MAIGDAAAAAGLTVYAATQAAQLGYQNDNQRGDDIAAVMAHVGMTGTNVSGAWTAAMLGGKHVFTQYFNNPNSAADYGALGGTNWTQAVQTGVAVPTGYTWEDFTVRVDVWAEDTTNNNLQNLIVGGLAKASGTASTSLIFYNPTGSVIPIANMNLTATVTLTEI